MDSTTRTAPRHIWLLALLMVTFAIGTDDFVVAGALPELSRSVGVSEGTAGQLVTVFSLAYAVSAPVMAALTSHIPPRRLLGFRLAIFAVLNFATALAPSFAVLTVLRVVTAIVAGTLSPAAFAIAGQRVKPRYAGRAIGVVAAGLTVSLAVGVPVGTWLSTRWGWHATFLAVGIFTVVALVTVVVTLPGFDPVTDASIGERLRVLRSPAILAGAGTTTIGACAGQMPYTYIAPITEAITARPALLTVFIGTVGTAGAIGAAVGGSIADRWGARSRHARHLQHRMDDHTDHGRDQLDRGAGLAGCDDRATRDLGRRGVGQQRPDECPHAPTRWSCRHRSDGPQHQWPLPLAASLVIGVCGVAAMLVSVVRWPTKRPEVNENAAA